MARCTLIADSGSTKTDWALITEKYGMLEIRSVGINPIRDSQYTIFSIIQQEVLPQIPSDITVEQIYFYGAGCLAPFSRSLEESFAALFPSAKVEVSTDLLGAARALCGTHAGIACILGTGANSCLYDGEKIEQNVSPLGFILGDEGSGAVLGRTLVGNVLKGIFSEDLQRAFQDRFSLSTTDIIERVYRQPKPNFFLASLVPFLAENRQHPQIHSMLVECFAQFFRRNIVSYAHPEMPVHFVGSIAYYFREELEEAAMSQGFRLGKVIQRPISLLAEFHQNSQ